MNIPTMLRVGAVLGWLLASGSAALAQTADTGSVRLFGGAGWLSLWDDETMLGRGVLINGGIALPLAAGLSLEGEIAGAGHTRDAGYLAARGTPLLAVGRAAFHFRHSAATARPFASAGVGVLHSTGRFTTRSIVPDDRGFPVEGPSTHRDWSLTQPALELGAGVSIRSAPRLSIRPEFRWTVTGAGSPGAVRTLEPPLLMMRAGVTIEWHSRDE